MADNLSFEPLLTVDNDGRPAPNLAKRWSRSEDGLTWTFELRDGLLFHDGTGVTAERVAETLNGVLNEPNAVAQAPSFQQVTSVNAESPTTFAIRLKKPSALLLSDLVFVNVTRSSANGRVGTGPFVVESQDEKRIVMRRFDKYHQGEPTIERVELNSFPTVRNAWTALMRGEVDFLYEVGADAAEFVDDESSVQTFTFLRPYTLTLGFNLKHSVLRSREVRQALNRAVDRDAIVEAAFHGRGQPADGPLWPHYWAFSSAAPKYTYNRDAAALGLTAAGYGSRRKTDSGMPSRFQFRCLVFPTLERVALMVQKQLFEIGVDMRIELAAMNVMAQRFASGDYDAFLIWQVNGRSLTWPYLFWRSPEPGRPAFIQTGYSAADTALDQVRYARNDEELRNSVAAFQQVMFSDPPAVFIAWEQRVRAVSRKFSVPPLEPGRDVVANLWRWRPAEANTASAR